MSIKPEIKEILVPFLDKYPPVMNVFKGLDPVAKSRGIKLVKVPLQNFDDLVSDFEQRNKAGVKVDAILAMPEPISHLDKGWEAIVGFANQHKLPISAMTPDMLQGGALFTYSILEKEMGEMTAPLAKKILDGTPAGTIPVVTPKIYLRINHKVAQQLGITIPENILKLAEEVIR